MFAKSKFPTFKLSSKERRDKSVTRFLREFKLCLRQLVKVILIEKLVTNLQTDRPPVNFFDWESHDNSSTYHLALGKNKFVFLEEKDRAKTQIDTNKSPRSGVIRLNYDSYGAFKPLNHRCSNLCFVLRSRAMWGNKKYRDIYYIRIYRTVQPRLQFHSSIDFGQDFLRFIALNAICALCDFSSDQSLRKMEK